MAIQIKRQGGGATSTAAAASPSSLNYGELACASNGDLYVGNGSRKPVGVVTTNGNKNISGPTTFSDNITFANNRAIFGYMASNDQWRIMGQGDTTDSGSLEIATGGNGNEPIYVRQYSQGGFPGSSIARTLTLLDDIGDSFFPGNVGVEGNTLNITNSNDADWASLYVRGAKNQRIRLGVGNSTAGQSSQAFMELGTMTNDGQILPISIRQYSDTSWHTVKYTLTLLDAYGNSAFPGNLATNSYIAARGLGTGQTSGQVNCINGSKSVMLRNDGGTFYALISTASNAAWTSQRPFYFNLSDGYLHATRVYNAVYNDYAEFFPRSEKNSSTEPGDLISLDMSQIKEGYHKAIKGEPIVGVESNEFGMLIGGDEPSIEDNQKGNEYFKYNIKSHIPVGLCGRCKIKIKGKILKGQKVVISDTPGVGRAYNKATDSIEDYIDSVGIAVEDQQIDDDKIRLVRVKLG